MTEPLSGIRVLEMATAIQGPGAAMFLGDMGAEVIKVEPPWVTAAVITAARTTHFRRRRWARSSFR